MATGWWTSSSLEPSRFDLAHTLTGSGTGAVQRELKRLTSSGLLSVKRIGRQKHYQANPDCPMAAVEVAGEIGGGEGQSIVLNAHTDLAFVLIA